MFHCYSHPSNEPHYRSNAFIPADGAFFTNSSSNQIVGILWEFDVTIPTGGLVSLKPLIPESTRSFLVTEPDIKFTINVPNRNVQLYRVSWYDRISLSGTSFTKVNDAPQPYDPYPTEKSIYFLNSSYNPVSITVQYQLEVGPKSFSMFLFPSVKSPATPISTVRLYVAPRESTSAQYFTLRSGDSVIFSDQAGAVYIPRPIRIPLPI